jgi:hypothetical protein
MSAMSFRRSVRWLLACSIAAGFATASAAPEECLTLRDNTAVAGCANKYAPATTVSPSTRPSNRPALQPSPRPIEVAEQALLFPIPTAASRASAAPKPEAPAVVAARDRSELIHRSEMGAAGLAGMGLIFGAWRWRASKVKTCSSCGTRITPGAAVCKRCFRSV